MQSPCVIKARLRNRIFLTSTFRESWAVISRTGHKGQQSILVPKGCLYCVAVDAVYFFINRNKTVEIALVQLYGTDKL